MIQTLLNENSVAVVTGGAAGIGLAIARRFAGYGMAVVFVDRKTQQFDQVTELLKQAGARDVHASSADVTDHQALVRLEQDIAEKYGGVDILVNNAGIQPGSSMFGPMEDWHRILDTNFWGVVNGTRAFVPRMIERGRPGIVINTGSKQGITTPPGDPAYNVSKTAVKSFTEALAHELRNTEGARISAHLLIPGFVFTDLNRKGRTSKPDGAWTPGQTVDFMMERLAAGDFYILCPDNDVTRELDEKRMAWSMGDIIENRPALSRWHPDFTEAFDAYIKKG
jgi:NAD(P)-dependent dehydrogenase (short-subunit alcohol dehydrogenase family)